MNFVSNNLAGAFFVGSREDFLLFHCERKTNVLELLLQLFKEKSETHLDFLSIPQLGGENVKTFRWDQRLQIQGI